MSERWHMPLIQWVSAFLENKETYMLKKKKKRSAYKIMTDDHRALRELRLEKGWTLEEACKLLGIKSKGLGHIENGRVILSKERLRRILECYGMHFHDLIRMKKLLESQGRNTPRRATVRRVLSSKDRRSYQKIITKEVRVLRLLRKMKGIPQDKASSLCRYARATIGHVENGRIELTVSRIQHIVTSYGHEMREFYRLMGEDVLRDVILEFCQAKLLGLSEEKLRLAQALIASL